MVMAPPMNATSATSVGRSATPSSLARGSGVLRASNNGEEIAPVDLSVRQNGNICRGSASCDFSQEDAARRGELAQFSKCFAVDCLVGY